MKKDKTGIEKITNFSNKHQDKNKRILKTPLMIHFIFQKSKIGNNLKTYIKI
jgi:hypothetical protein